MSDNLDRLRITEIFCSLQGESKTVGLPTVFIRLTGCPLRCGYCDTAYAFQGGEWFSMEQIVDRAKSFGVRHVTVTGGEPLAQKRCIELLALLCDQGFSVSLETSGALDISSVDSRVSRVMDLKTPSSGEMDKNLYSNIDCLQPTDQLKFVIGDRADYEWAAQKVDEYSLASRCEVLFSPVFESLKPTTLADWIVEDRLQVRFQLQLHKLLWNDEPGR